MTKREIVYVATPTLSTFHKSTAFVRGVRGPVGSGKSSACSWEIFRRASEQAPGDDGLRHTRWVVVRNTYRELSDTTLKTWLDWFPEEAVGKFNRLTMTHNIRYKDVSMEVMFRALDRPDDVKKVLSLEITGAWINEAREVPKSIVDALGDRCGRFPSMRHGGCTWRGVLMDTNSPDTDHWWYRLAEEEPAHGWEFYAQPPGLIEASNTWHTNPDAENLPNLENEYYRIRSAGKSRDYIMVYYANQYGFVKDGKPIFPEYLDSAHCAPVALEPVRNSTIYVGIDFGLTPAAVFGQRTARGQWLWIDELVTEDMGMVRFAELLGAKMRGDYRDFKFEIWGDPAGDQRAQSDETTCFEILKAHKIDGRPCDTNDPTIRRESVAVALSRMIDGKPGLLISPKCVVLRKAMGGGYCYKRVQVVGDERFHDKPDKNRFSHVSEAAQYMMVGAGEGRTLVGKGLDWAPLPKYPKSQVV